MAWRRLCRLDGCQSKISRVYRHPVTNFLKALDHDTLARFKALLNDPKAAASFTDAHWFDVGFIVCVHDVNLIRALQFRNRALRHHQSAVPYIELYPYSHEFAGTKRILGIRKDRLQSERSGGGANRPVRRINLASLRIDSAIGQDQLNLQLLQARLAVGLLVVLVVGGALWYGLTAESLGRLWTPLSTRPWQARPDRRSVLSRCWRSRRLGKRSW